MTPTTSLSPQKWLLCCLIVHLIAPIAIGQEKTQLYAGFKEPAAIYKPLPIWYWNSKLEPNKIKHQIDQYLLQGAQGAIVYPSTALQTPFLSEEWWSVWAEILPYARAKNFDLGWVPEFNDPDGDARDIWEEPPNQSRVIDGHPAFRLKRLAFTEREASGPGTVRFESLPTPVLAIAARKKDSDSLDSESLQDLSTDIHGSRFEANLSDGNWLISFYYVVNSEGYKGTTRVDPLNRKATDRYIDITLGEFARRFPEYLGSTLKYIMLDSEGSFGGPIVWTPEFFERFRVSKGYDFRKYLPVLTHDGGPFTARVRNDYYDVVSDLFVHNFWAPIANWGAKYHLIVVAQELGDGLQLEAAAGGNFMEIQRAMTIPFMEEEESGAAQIFRDPRQFKEPDSIAHFEGKRFWCECLLVQGVGSYVSPQKMRDGTNVIAAWGVNLWSQNTSYDDDNAVWPPSMGTSQPHWKYFHDYAALVSRISYMNDGGRHVADVLLFRPTASAVAYSDPAFDSEVGGLKGRRRTGYSEFGSEEHGHPYLLWGGDFSWQVEMDYWALMQVLAQKQEDYDIVNDFYLARAKLNAGAVQLGNESYHVLVLPPMRVISRVSLQKIRDFYDAGGNIVAYGSLPWGSTEQGMGDPEVIHNVETIFGIDPRQSEQATKETENQHEQTGQAIFIPHGLERVARAIARMRPLDFQVQEGSADHLFYLHRIKEGQDLYWVVNDSGQPRELVLSLASEGEPELWNPEDGSRKKAMYWSHGARTFVHLNLHARDGTYVVFGSSGHDTPHPAIERTNVEDLQLQERPDGVEVSGRVLASDKEISIEGTWHGNRFHVHKQNQGAAKPEVLSPDSWTFHVDGPVLVRYAQTAIVNEGEGLMMGFAENAYNDRAWNTAFLSPEITAIRDWNLIGPFPNVDHEGFDQVYPPEQEINLDARYEGIDGQQVAWRQYHSGRPEIDVQRALALNNTGEVAYALTYVWTAQAQRAQGLLAGENLQLFVNGKRVLKLHPMPWYYELRDGFAFKPTIDLNPGWNQLLIKIEHDPGRFGRVVFSLRLADFNAVPLSGLLFSAQRDEPERLHAQESEPATQERWYRVQVPPGTSAVRLPSTVNISAVYLNGRQLTPAGERVQLGNLDWSHTNELSLVISGAEELNGPLQFESGSSKYRLGSWTWTGLTSFSGEATYDKNFRLDPTLVGKQIDLDLGQVGVTAEVWVNEKRVGERIWDPFQMDITQYLHAGENHLRIIVTNTDSNLRAEQDTTRYIEKRDLPGGRAAVYMDSLSRNGLIGPVRLVPYNRVHFHIPEKSRIVSRDSIHDDLFGLRELPADAGSV